MERAASRYFGIMGYGAHLNGFTRRGGRAHAWIARRSADKPVDPGKLDNLVGGRIAAGMSVDETLRKEAWEEAGIAPGLLAGLNCISAVRVEYSVPEGLHREVLFVHDLWLPEDFTPTNQDGEVSEIRSIAVEELPQELLGGDFTLDAGVVMIDGLLRLGAVLPEDSQYLDLLRLMKP
jgi:8-oxo-dGTP pyrophosphatase MutT (NUDIX family)